MLVAQRSWHWRSFSRCSMSLVIEMKRKNKSIKWITFKLCLIYRLYNFSLIPMFSYDGFCLWVKPLLEPQWNMRQGGLACCSPWGRRVGYDWATELNWNMRVRLRSVGWQLTCPVFRAQTAGFVGVLAISYNETVKGKLTQSLRKHFFHSVWEIFGLFVVVVF